VNDVRDDDLLRERFLELRAEASEPGRVPDFRAMLGAARAEAAGRPTLGVLDGGEARAGRARSGGRRLFRAGAWASAALAATVAGLLLFDGRSGDDDEFVQVVMAYSSDASGGAWQSPTSGLLEFPGVELVRSVPSLGAPLRGLDSTTLPASPTTPGEVNR